MKRFSTALLILMGAGLIPAPVSAGGQSSGPESSEELGRAAQRELARLGCFSGDINEGWGREGRAAIKRFNQTSQTKWPDWPAADMIGSLRTYADGYCTAAASAAPEKKPAMSSVAKLPAETPLEERSAPPVPLPAPAPPAVAAVEKTPVPSAAKAGQWQPAQEIAATAPAPEDQMFPAAAGKVTPKADIAKPPDSVVRGEQRPNSVTAPRPPVAPVAPPAPAPMVASAPEVAAAEPAKEPPAQQPSPRASWLSSPKSRRQVKASRSVERQGFGWDNGHIPAEFC